MKIVFMGTPDFARDSLSAIYDAGHEISAVITVPDKQLKHILSDKQWKKYKESYYFYRPISWRNNVYIHNIYARYPKHNWKSDKHHHHHRGDFGRPGKPHKYDKHYKKHYKNYKKAKREFGNNSPEAIRMRHEMRKDAMRGAR